MVLVERDQQPTQVVELDSAVQKSTRKDYA
jgi:hypothetical protein